MASQATFLLGQFLCWVDEQPRGHAEVRQVWQSTCPLNCVWEDAIVEGLVAFGPSGALCLTARGRALLATSRQQG